MFARGQGPICLGLLCEGINKGLQGVFRSLGPYISAVGSNLQDKDKGPMEVKSNVPVMTSFFKFPNKKLGKILNS